MARAYSRDSVETHNEHYGKVRPAVNVKVYHLPSAFKISDHFKCSEEIAEKAGGFAFDSACEQFWSEAQGIFDDVYGPHVATIYSEGRSGGWLVVDGLDSIENWSLMQLNKWHSFESRIKAEIKYRTSQEVIFEDIEANEWTKDGAEPFNFIQFEDGHSESIPDLKAKAIKSGFAPVVRS
jgi:hypothetical protein